MTWFERLINRFGYARKAQVENPPTWLSATAEFEQFDVPEPWLARSHQELYQRLTWVQIAISTVAQTAANVPFRVATLTNEDEAEIVNHPFEQLLRRPNPLMSRSELLEATYAFQEITGGCYWWLNKATPTTPPDEIWVLPTSKVTPVPDGRSYLRGYLYEPEGGGVQVPLDVDEIVHFRRFHPNNSFVGLSAIEAYAIDAEGDLSMQAWNRNYFGPNNAKMEGALAFSDPISDPDWQKIKADVRNRHGGTKREMMMLRNAGKGGVQWLPMAVSQKDMEFLSGRNFTKEEIFAMHAPGLASILAINATEANSMAGKGTFLEFGVWPKMSRVAEKIVNDILPLYGDNLTGAFEDIRITDRVMELQEITAFSRVHTIDEVRARYYKAKPIGDERGKLLIAEVPVAPTALAAEALSLQQAQVEAQREQAQQQREQQSGESGETEAPKAPAEPEAPEAPTVETPEEPPVKRSAFKAHSGSIVAFFLPPNIIVQLAMTQRSFPIASRLTSPGEMHLTLAYLGEAANLSDEQRFTLNNALAVFAQNEQPIIGRLNGIGRFHGVGDAGEDAIYATFDSPQLPAWRQRLNETLISVGLMVDVDRGFIPHVTLGYMASDLPTPLCYLPSDDITFNSLWITYADIRQSFRLEGTPATTEQPANEQVGTQVGLPDDNLRIAEIKAFRKWRKRHGDEDVEAFKSDILSDDDKFDLIDQWENGSDQPLAALLGGGITHGALKAMLLQLDPNDDEAEQKIRMAVERRSERNIHKAFRDMVETLYPQGYGDFADPDVEANRIHNEFLRNQQLRDEIDRALIDSADLGVSVGIDQLERVGFGFDYTLAHVQARDWASRQTDEILRQLANVTQRGVGQAIARWAENGEPLEALISDIEPFFGRRRARTIAATEVTRAYYQGTVESYRQSGVIQRLEYRTSRDEKVCPICGPLHGQQTDLGGTFGGVTPPVHVSCRCWAVPVVEALRP